MKERKNATGRKATRQRATAMHSQFFVSGEGIDREVITTDICRYLGNDALVVPGEHEDKNTGTKQYGFYITAYRPLTSEMLADIRGDSAKWRAERQLKINPLNTYQYDTLVRTVEHLVPTKKDLPIYLNWPFNSSLCRACADFGAAANIIDSSYAREINVNIIPDSNCDPFELPTFGTLIRPIGRAKFTCAFPGEVDPKKEYDFFVFENFVYPVIMGREFLRETGTLETFQHRLHDRPIVKREIPIVAFLGAEEETLTIFVDGEELDSAPDTGSEVNVMSLEFAKRRGFNMMRDNVHAVRFANGSLQDVVGRVTVPLSFSNGPPSRVLLKLVDQFSATQRYESDEVGEGEELSHPHNITIAADFHILDGLKNNMILGEDLLALYPALATIGLFKKAGKRVCAMVGRTAQETKDPLRERDIADSQESDRYERERAMIKTLPERERELATRRNDETRAGYLRERNRFASNQ